MQVGSPSSSSHPPPPSPPLSGFLSLCADSTFKWFQPNSLFFTLTWLYLMFIMKAVLQCPPAAVIFAELSSHSGTHWALNLKFQPSWANPAFFSFCLALLSIFHEHTSTRARVFFACWYVSLQGQYLMYSRNIWNTCSENSYWGAREVAERLRSLVALAEGSSWVPSTHMVANNFL